MSKLLKDRIDKNRVLAVVSTIVLTACIYKINDLGSQGKHADATPYWAAISSIIFYWIPSPGLQFGSTDRQTLEEDGEDE